MVLLYQSLFLMMQIIGNLIVHGEVMGMKTVAGVGVVVVVEAEIEKITTKGGIGTTVGSHLHVQGTVIDMMDVNYVVIITVVPVMVVDVGDKVALVNVIKIPMAPEREDGMGIIIITTTTKGALR